MKKYIFLTNSIRNMGGAQMYLRNKILFLEERGWSTDVYYFTQGDILIPELKRYEVNRTPLLEKPIYAVSEKKIARFVNRFAEQNRNYTDIIIESHVLSMSLWGELMAKSVEGRCILFPLHESLPKANEKEKEYLLFKYKRGEWVSSSKRLKRIIDQPVEDNLFLYKIPSYSNVVGSEYINLSYDKSIYSILSLGRLDKPYIMPMLQEINNFCTKNSIEVNLLFVGGAAEESYITAIKSYLQNCSYIHPIFLGYLYPIATNILEASDVAIASSGSILIPYEYGIPTIAIDIDTYRAIGIYGHTTWNKWKRTDEEELPTSLWLERILIHKQYTKTKPIDSNQKQESDEVFQKHIDLLSQMSSDRDYFEVLSIYSPFDIISRMMKAYIIQLLGENTILKIPLIPQLNAVKNKLST